MSLIELYYLPINIQGFDPDLDDAIHILDHGEKARYHCFKNMHAQSCYLQARRIAKTTLAKKLCCPPEALSFSYTETEKPFLKKSKWHFNISHSKSTVVTAIAPFAIGVDVEDIDRCLKVWPKAEEFLNAHVKKRVDFCTSEKEAAATFAEYWSCTESYIKLKGSTIYRDKNRVEVQLHSNFDEGRRYTFEDTFITSFDFIEASRLSIACENGFPSITLTDWRTGVNRNFAALD